jgi:hypothetical protein
MRVTLGSGRSQDAIRAEIDRHLDMMGRFIAHIGGGRPTIGREASRLTMIVRSAQSAPAQALISLTEEFLRAGATAKVVIGQLEPEADVRQLFAALSRLSRREPPQELIRWVRNPRLLEAHEQVTYGASMCWSGDCMRRDAGRRNTLTLFDEAAPQAALLARLAFEALWNASAPVPKRRLAGPAALRPSGEYQPDAQGVAVSPLRPSLQGWPLVRH